jgi:hypothetical protein
MRPRSTKPVLGVNVGRLGFLAELETDEFDELGKLAAGNYQIEQRMMLEIRYMENGREKTCTALNDAVISRGALSPMPDFRVGFNGQTVCDYRGDGPDRCDTDRFHSIFSFGGRADHRPAAFLYSAFTRLFPFVADTPRRFRAGRKVERTDMLSHRKRGVSYHGRRNLRASRSVPEDRVLPL